MRLTTAAGLITAMSFVACGGSGPTHSPTMPSAITMAGTWTGSASDSSGTMMGGGVAASMMGGATWSITQTGDDFYGSMRLGGHHGGTIMVAGTMHGRTGTFTMTMPAGFMSPGHCSATATGTFDMDEMMRFHGTYTGTNTCTGPFGQGHMNMTHR